MDKGQYELPALEFFKYHNLFRCYKVLKLVKKSLFSQNNLSFKASRNLNHLRYLKNSKAGNSFWPLSTFPSCLLRLYMQPDGRGKATKVDKNVAKWTKNMSGHSTFSSV